MAMIEGLKLTVSGKELSKLAEATAQACVDRAEAFEAMAEEHAKTEEHKGGHPLPKEERYTDDVMAPAAHATGIGMIGQMFKMGALPNAHDDGLHECGYMLGAKQCATHLRSRAEWLRFAAAHLSPRNTYLLTEGDYLNLSVVPYENVPIAR